MEIKSASDRQVSCGSYCDVQGVLQFIDEISVTFIVAVTVHSFMSIIRDRRSTDRPLLWGTYAIDVWKFVLLFTAVNWVMTGKGEGRFFAPTSYRVFLERSSGRVHMDVNGKHRKYCGIHSVIPSPRGHFPKRLKDASAEKAAYKRESWWQLGVTIPRLRDGSLVAYAIFLVNLLLITNTRVNLLIGLNGALHASNPRRVQEEGRTQLDIAYRLETFSSGGTPGQQLAYRRVSMSSGSSQRQNKGSNV
ncbi:hypothetical protein BDV93DRAFT_507314 [Ceratobasidium sp. AG-I]|nr:hypothetical protein BDV93DRAFT_507314 [Ceratobasidium sp. AG-I]